MLTEALQSHYAARFSGVLVPALILVAAGCASNKPVSDNRPASFWPPYPDEPRIQYLTSYNASTDVQPEKSKLDELIYGKEPEKSLSLVKPYGVEMWNGKIYVCDLRNTAVTVLDVRNHRVLVLGKTPTDALQSPTDVAISADGIKYVADQGADTIAVYDADDRRITTFGVKGSKPVGVAVYQNLLYICDFQNPRVLVLDRLSGSLLRVIGEAGGGPGQFVRPLGIAVDKQGFVYVVDLMKCDVQKFDPQGKFVSRFGTVTDVAGGLVRPKHIDVDSNGIIYVVDAAFQNVQLFNQEGQVLTFFGTAGNHPGAMYLPAGICVHDGDLGLFAQYIHPAFQAEHLIVVTNQFGRNKVAVYAMGHLKPGKTVQDIVASRGRVPTGTTRPTTGPVVPTTLPANMTFGPQPAVDTDVAKK